jgi:RNA polymerase-binding protein DksA
MPTKAPKKNRKLTKRELAKFRTDILKQMADMGEDMSFIRENAISDNIKDATGDHSSYSFHMADQGTDAMEREKAFLLASRESVHLERLRNAIKRIDEGTFGICGSCGEPIAKERLKAVPTATLCVPCKTAKAGGR